jgi:hypothetical protein
MDFNEEMNSIGKAEVSAAYIDAPCVEKVVIKDYKLVNPDKGTPYLEVIFETIDASKRTNKARLYRAKDGDSEQGRAWKLKRIKELMVNAGCELNEDGTFKLQGEEVLKFVKGKTVNALFKSVEKIGYNKDENNKPNIFTMIEYSFSSHANKDIVGNASYLQQTLSDKDRAKFDGEMTMWMRDNGGSTATPTTQPDAIVEAQANAATDNSDMPEVSGEEPSF